MSKTFTKADVATHKDEAAGMYIIIDNGVYNITGTPLPPPILSTTPTSNHPPPPPPQTSSKSTPEAPRS